MVQIKHKALLPFIHQKFGNTAAVWKINMLLAGIIANLDFFFSAMIIWMSSWVALLSMLGWGGADWLSVESNQPANTNNNNNTAIWQTHTEGRFHGTKTHVIYSCCHKNKTTRWKHAAAWRRRLDFRGFVVISPSWSLFIFLEPCESKRTNC